MDDVYNNIDIYRKKLKILVVLDDLITGIMFNKIFQAIIKELLYHIIFLFCSKRSHIKFYKLLINEDS